jgi:hypothetical protein
MALSLGNNQGRTFADIAEPQAFEPLTLVNELKSWEGPSHPDLFLRLWGLDRLEFECGG